MRGHKTIESAAIVIIAMLVLSPHLAQAQDRANAEELFQLGKTALLREDYAKACDYFQASLNADFALGTILNLAACHEHEGKFASAWAEYRTLEDRARRATPPQPDRVEFAREHAEALRPKLSHLRIVLSPEAAHTRSLVVKIDGSVTAVELFEAGVPVDPGRRTITASAPEYDEWSAPVDVDRDRRSAEITIPPLKHAPWRSKIDPAEADRLAAERSQRTVGYVVGGIGAASLVTGIVFGLLASSAASDSKCAAPCYTTNANNTPNQTLIDAHDAYTRANAFGWVSNITMGVGAVGIGVGTWLVLTASSSSSSSLKNNKSRSAAVTFAPLARGSGGTVIVEGIFER